MLDKEALNLIAIISLEMLIEDLRFHVIEVIEMLVATKNMLIAEDTEHAEITIDAETTRDVLKPENIEHAETTGDATDKREDAEPIAHAEKEDATEDV
jgi:Zn-dependent metalloprotease